MSEDWRKRAKDAKLSKNEDYVDELTKIIVKAMKTTEEAMKTKKWKYCPVCGGTLLRVTVNDNLGFLCPECGILG